MGPSASSPQWPASAGKPTCHGFRSFWPRPTSNRQTPGVKAHEADNFGHYGTSKQAINAYVATHAFPFLAKGIRINAICPGPTDTPLARANADLWLSFAQDYREATGTATHTPEQMGNVMAFLNSDAAAGVNGVTLLVDYGHVNSSNTGTFAAGKPIIDLLMGRISLG